MFCCGRMCYLQFTLWLLLAFYYFCLVHYSCFRSPFSPPIQTSLICIGLSVLSISSVLSSLFSLWICVLQFRQAKTEIVNASRVAYRFMAGLASKNQASPESLGNNQNRGSPTFQGAWFKNIISAGAKPSASGSTPTHSQDAGDGTPLRRQSSTEQSTQL